MTGGPLAILDAEGRIMETLRSYVRAVDARDWELLGGCFTPHAHVSFRGFNDYSGREAVVEGCRRSLARFVETRHLIGDATVATDMDGNSATSRCAVIATHLRSVAGGMSVRFTIGGTYTDRLVLAAGRWQIDQRVLEVEWSCGNPATMQ